MNFGDAVHEFVRRHHFFDTLEAELLEKHYGVFSCRTPQVRIEISEQCLGFAVPYPPEVLSKFVKSLELGRKFGFDSNVAPHGGVSVAYR